MPVDIVNGNRNGKPGVMLGNGNGNGLTMGPWTLSHPEPNLQLTGVGSGQVIPGQDLVDSNGNVKNPFTSPLLDNLGGKPKNSGGNGWNGMQPVLDFTPQEEDRNRRPFVGPPPPSKPADSGPFGPPDTSYSGGGGGDFGEGDYNYEEDNLVNRPIAKSNNQNYIQPLMGEKKII